MKKLLIFLLLGVPLASCDLTGDDFLAPQNTSALTEETVFTDSIQTTAFLTRIYSDIGVGFDLGMWASHGNINQATDDAEYTLSASTQVAVQHYSGTLNPSMYPTDGIFNSFWRMPYENIRRVNMLIANIDRAPLSQTTKTRMLGEARYLRAWYYANLIKQYGGVPLIGNQIFTALDIINVPRDTYVACVQYIVDELDAAAEMLDQELPDQFYGRANKGACLGLKSRVLLYAASPLFNGGAIEQAKGTAVEPIVSYPDYDVARWQKAADAAQDLISRGWYSLHVNNTTEPGLGFYEVFLKRVNTEYIFARHRAPNRDIEGHFFPSTRGGGRQTQPTQNLVDAFPMVNGLPIDDPASGYDPNNPYVNRDPRFANSIIYNESELWWGSFSSMRPVYTFDGVAPFFPTSAQDQYGQNGTSTGYYGRKMAEVKTSANTERGWPLIRYAEILLNYAEALNELGRTEEAVEQMKLIRERAGIQAGADSRYGIPAGIDVEAMREIIHNERRIELSFEGGHRYWDLRRWKKMEVGQRQNEVMRITRTADGTYNYNRGLSIRVHNFRPALYLYPIPQTEINKMPLMLQNPGY